MIENSEEARREAELARRVKDLEQRRVVTKQAQVTEIDTLTNTFTADLPPDSDGVVQTLKPIAAPPQFLPAVGQWVKLRLEGAKPIYEPAGISENAVTGREIAPGAVTTPSLAQALLDQLGGAIIHRQPTQPADPPAGRSAYWWEPDGAGYKVRQYNPNTDAWDLVTFGNGAITPGSLIASDVLATGTVSAELLEAVMVLSSALISGDPNGDRVEIDANGIRRYVAGLDEPTVDIPGGAEGRAYWQVTDQATGVTLANIDQEGNFNGQAGNFATLTVGGQEFVPRSAEDQDGPRGVVEYGGSYLTTVATTTERGWFEVAADLEVGRLYEIQTSYLLLQSSVAGTVVRCKIRMTQDGSTPTITSDSIATGSKTAGSGDEGMMLYRLHTPSVDGTHRFLLTYAKQSGTGNATIFGRSFEASPGLDSFPIQMIVKDIGPFRGNNAVANDGGGAAATAKKTYTKRYNPVWSGTYAGGTLDASKGNEMIQGFYGGISYRSMVGFDYPTITADLAGATVESCVIVLYARHWYYNAGGTAVIGTHSNTTKPGTWSAVTPDQWRSGSWPKPGQRRVSLGTGVGNQFKSGTVKGITLGPAPSSDLTYYGRFAGAAQSYQPYLEIRYSV